MSSYGIYSVSAKFEWHKSIGNTYVAPQVWGIQAQLPATTVETSVKMREYTTNSTARGIKFRKFAVNSLGDARWEKGSLMRSRNSGDNIIMFDSDRWMRNDMDSRDAEDFPGRKYWVEWYFRWDEEVITLTSKHKGCQEQGIFKWRGWQCKRRKKYIGIQ